MGSFTDIYKTIRHLSVDSSKNLVIDCNGKELRLKDQGLTFTGTITNALDFDSSDGSEGASTSWLCDTTGVDSDGAIKIIVNDVTYYIPFFNAAHTSGT